MRKVFVSTLIFILAAVAAIILLTFSNDHNVEDESPTQIDTASWRTYENNEFSFKLRYPAGWEVFEAPDDKVVGPVFNFYPREYKTQAKFPLIHHSIIPNVSVFPRGVPTEGIFGDNQTSAVQFKEIPSKALDFTLQNGDVWATYANYNSGPKGWDEPGFIFARDAINGFKEVCLKDGEEVPPDSCDYLGSDNKPIYKGNIDKQMRLIEEEILKSFEFISK